MADEEEVEMPTKVLLIDDPALASCHFVAAQLGRAFGAVEEGAIPREVSVAAAVDDEAVAAADVVVCTVQGNDARAIGLADLALLAAQSAATAEGAKEKTFVLVSTAMTWARTPAETEGEEDEEEPPTRLEVSDEDFKKRRAHPAYKGNLTLERAVYKANAGLLKTYVVCAGLPYGCGESELVFHELFKSAWHNSALSVPGAGANYLPTIHVTDLAAIVAKVASTAPEQRYVNAVDASGSTLSEVAQAISKELGVGEVVSVDTEEVTMTPDMDHLCLDQKLSSSAVGELGIEWVCEEGLLGEGALSKVLAEYRSVRGLTPVSLFIYGPTASGTETTATAVAKEYKLVHLTAAAVEAEALGAGDALAALMAKTKAKVEGGASEEAQERAKRNYAKLMVKAFRRKLNTPACCNQGYVLADFPVTHAQSEKLFKPLPDPEAEEEAEEEEVDDELEDAPEGEEEEAEAEAEPAAEEEEGEEAEEVVPPKESRVPTPGYVMQIVAEDGELEERVKNWSEADIVSVYGSEEGFKTTLAAWRAADAAKPTPLDWWEGQDIDPVTVQFKDNAATALADKIGAPHNYGPSEADIAEAKAVAAAAEAQRLVDEEAADAKTAAEQAGERAKKDKEMAVMLAALEKEEDEILKLRSLPLRKYLMDNVIPTLTQGLIQTCKSRPVDPIDHLAEFLFKACEDMEE